MEGFFSPSIRYAHDKEYTAVEYFYDTRGNILSKTYSLGDTVVDTITYGYTDAKWKDRLTSYNGVAITADTIGNPLSWHDGSTMTWQRGRQLLTYTKNGVTTTFGYDQDGIRRAKTTNGVRTEYDVYDGTLRRMTDGTNTLQFVYGSGLSSVIYNGTEYWYVFNAQNDVIGLINASGEYVVEYTYDAWGKLLSTTGSLASTLGKLNPFRYRGYIYDEETGFYYVSSRYYDPAIGRWLNADKYASTGQGALGHNMFAYCGNNPIMHIDPSGECWHRLWIFGDCDSCKEEKNQVDAVSSAQPELPSCVSAGSVFYSLSKGWNVRIDPENTSTKTQRHIHVEKAGQTYSQNQDGSPHDGSTGSPPNKVLKELDEETGWGWKAREQSWKNSQNMMIIHYCPEGALETGNCACHAGYYTFPPFVGPGLSGGYPIPIEVPSFNWGYLPMPVPGF